METTVRESLLTKFTELVGDRAMESVFATMYASGTFKALLFLACVVCVAATGLMLHMRRPIKYPLVFFIALFFLQPYNRKPIGFVILDSMARVTSAVIDRGILQFTADNSDPDAATNMHPGLVMDLFAAAAGSEIKDPQTREELHKFLAKCMDNALTTRGEPAVYDDVFSFGTSYHTTGPGGNVVTNFVENKLDPRSLSNDDSIAELLPGKNCGSALAEVRAKIAADLDSQPMIVNDRIMTGASSGDPDKTKSTDKWFRNWQNSNPPLMNLARNVRMGIASQYEKSRLINDMGWDNWWFGSYYKSTNMDPSLREMMLGLNSNMVDAGFAYSNIRELPARLSGSRWAFSLGAEMKELKEKLELLPYYLAVLKNVLKLICPFFIASIPLFGRFQLFSTWAGSWFTVVVSPSVITAMRSIHNSVILSKLGIQNLNAEVMGHKALASVVNIDQTKALMEDFIPLAYTMMKQETAIIGLLAGAIVGGSWYAGMLGNGMVGWLGSSITGQLLGTAIGGTIPVVSESLKNMGSEAFPKSDSNGGLRNSGDGGGGSGGSPSPSPTFSTMFARKES